MFKFGIFIGCGQFQGVGCGSSGVLGGSEGLSM